MHILIIRICIIGIATSNLRQSQCPLEGPSQVPA